ncbi:hypothetical protein V1509DRAFT_635788, partial [Lipomyces kononenkoae]
MDISPQRLVPFGWQKSNDPADSADGKPFVYVPLQTRKRLQSTELPHISFSSSLVCLHLANQSLQDHEADIAIIAGSALHFDPSIFISMKDLGMLATDGRSHAFDAVA